MARRKQDIERALRMPASFQSLSHPTLQAKPPEGHDWIHEIKFDGYRFQLNVAGSVATWFTRNGLDWTDKLAPLSKAAALLGDCILDGELCAVNARGEPDFSALRSSLNRKMSGRLVYFVFDILWRDTEDVRPFALATRKKVLAKLLEAGGDDLAKRIRYVDHFEGIAPSELVAAACRMRLEGIVSKRLSETYRAGRTTVWIKAKCRPSQEVVVGGWKAGPDGRFKGLLTGVYDRGELRYAGSLKNGFRDQDVTTLRPRLKALARSRTPFSGEQPKATGGDSLHFLEPELVAQAEIAEWTGSGHLRQASFKGFREDKAAIEVRREG